MKLWQPLLGRLRGVRLARTSRDGPRVAPRMEALGREPPMEEAQEEESDEEGLELHQVAQIVHKQLAALSFIFIWRSSYYIYILHCIALHCIALHCIALHYIALHCIALHYITLHYIALHYIMIMIITIIRYTHHRWCRYSALQRGIPRTRSPWTLWRSESWRAWRPGAPAGCGRLWSASNGSRWASCSAWRRSKGPKALGARAGGTRGSSTTRSPSGRLFKP